MADILKTKEQGSEKPYIQKNGKKQRELYYDEIAESQHKSETELKNYYGRNYRIPKSNLGDFMPIIILVAVLVIFGVVFFLLKSSRDNKNNIVANETDATTEHVVVASKTDVTTETTTEDKQKQEEILAKKHDVEVAKGFYEELIKKCEKDESFKELVLSQSYILNDMKPLGELNGSTGIDAANTDTDSTKATGTDTDEMNFAAYVILYKMATEYKWVIEYVGNGAKYYVIFGGEDSGVHIGIASDEKIYEIAPNICKEYDVE